MANITSIGTALPEFRHAQSDILNFMQQAYELNETDERKLAFLYRQSSINTRYSIISDFSTPSSEWTFIPANEKHGFPCLDKRMELYAEKAAPLSVRAIESCIEGHIDPPDITHLITVSCTGMSAPGLDLEIFEAMNLSPDIFRTSVNFMGCYAAIHALKMAKMICDSNPSANVIIVATELCTLHFQKEFTVDNAASSLLFADGSAAVLVRGADHATPGCLSLQSFYSKVALRGKKDMSWHISNKGFLMTLSAYIPQLIKEDIAGLVDAALDHSGLQRQDVTHWCLHPGGKKILEVIQQQMGLCDCQVSYSKRVLSDYGNMSSASILFVLKDMLEEENEVPRTVFGVAFGPGLTMETFIARSL